MTTQRAFDNFADAYEAMIDWDKRLANEVPLYRWLIDRVGARSALDVACGTGHHANLLHGWGLRVEGADLSDTMVARCRTKWGESDVHRWSVRRFDQPVETPISFDLAICTGNSLALAEDLETAARVIQLMLAAVRAGGAVLVHVLNLWPIPDGQCNWQKCRPALLPQGRSLIIKGVHRCGTRGFVDMLITNLETDPPMLMSECVPFLGLEKEQLGAMARQGGAGTVEFFGGYDRRAYDRSSSQDLIMIAIK